MIITNRLCQMMPIASAPTGLCAKNMPFMPSLSDLLRILRIGAKKSLSQNFVLNMSTNRVIAACAIRDLTDVNVVEIGPGPGGITRALLEQPCASLTILEIDRRFFPILYLLKDADPDRLHIIHGDAKTFDFNSIWQERKVEVTDWFGNIPNAHIIGNLPFNTATPILIRFLKEISLRTGGFTVGRTPLTLTFQHEVAQRIVAPVRGIQRCRLSAIAQAYTKPTVAKVLSGSCFSPRPLVDVGVVTMIPRKTPMIQQPFELVEKFCRNAFHYRQFPLYGAFASLYPKEDRTMLTNQLLERTSLGFMATRRCVELRMENMADMCSVYAEQCRQMPGLWLYDFRQPKWRDMSFLSTLEGNMPPEYIFPIQPRPSAEEYKDCDIGDYRARNLI